MLLSRSLKEVLAPNLPLKAHRKRFPQDSLPEVNRENRLPARHEKGLPKLETNLNRF
jgi:hypothetical protein